MTTTLRPLTAALVAGLAAWLSAPLPAAAQPLVPGTGVKVEGIGDDFEDPDWQYIPNDPKGSGDFDGRSRPPGGYSKNRRWYEGPERGQPDLVRRVETPEGGIPGSTGALQLASIYTGTPGRGNGERAQDDLFMHVGSPFGGSIPVSRAPSFVVRVFVPPLEHWEQRSGSSFGMRTTVRGSKPGTSKTEPYWPGMFFQYTPKREGEGDVWLVLRAGERGQDYRKLPIRQTGWWTLGMSFTPDGRVHYYAHPGVADLTAADHLASHYPYGFRCQQLKMAFFDIFNQNDGQNWSTSWVIDDPTIYTARGTMVVEQQPSRQPRSTRSR